LEKNTDASISCYRRAIRANPRYQRALYYTANALRFNRGDLGEIETLFRRSLEVNEAHPNTLKDYGTFLLRNRQNPEAALHFLVRAVALQPNIKTRLQYAEALSVLEKPREAFQQLEAVLRHMAEEGKQPKDLIPQFGAFGAPTIVDFLAAHLSRLRPSEWKLKEDLQLPQSMAELVVRVAPKHKTICAKVLRDVLQREQDMVFVYKTDDFPALGSKK
jgi:tetratricopeptide (TPR) repeat protein